MKLANRITKLKPSATIGVSDKVRELKNKGEKIISLQTGEPCFPTADNIKLAAKQALDENQTFYSHSKGSLELRKALCAYFNGSYNLDLDAEKNIIVVPGAKQAILYVLMSLINEGDEVIIPTPAWVSYVEMTKISGGVPVEVECDEQKGFSINVEDIKKKITEKSKVIMINSPNNPTGRIIPKEELEALADLCKQKGLILVSDEIYCTLLFDNNKFYSMLELDPELDFTVLINGFSKAYAMTGWRLGYAIAKPEMIQSMTKLQQHSATNPVTFLQPAGIEALKNGAPFIKNCLKFYQENKSFLKRKLSEIKNCDMCDSQGGLYAFIKIPVKNMGSEEFCIKFLEKSKVATVPGIAFGSHCDHYIRICLATTRENLNEFVNRLKDWT